MKLISGTRIRSLLDSGAEKLGLGGDILAIITGAALILMIQIVAAGLSYGSQVFLARQMGAYEFGIYVFAWSLVPPTAIAAAIGLSMAVVRFVPQYLVKDSWGHLSGLIRRCTSIVLVVGVVVGVIGWLVLVIFDDMIADYYITPLRLAILCIPFLTLVALLAGISRGFGWLQLAYIPQLILVPGLILLGVAVFSAIVGSPTAVIVLIIAVVACAFTALANTYQFRATIPKMVKGSEPIYETRLWLRVAVPLFLSDGVFLILWSTDSVMLGSLMGPNEVAIYHACVRTSCLTLLVFNAINGFAAPKFAALVVDHDKSALQKFARSIAIWMFWPTVLVVAATIILGKWILGTFGDSFVVGYPILVMMSIGYLIQASTGPVDTYLAVSGHHDSTMIINGLGALSNITLNIILIPRYGIMGAAIASVTTIVAAQIAYYILARHYLGVSSFIVSRAR